MNDELAGVDAVDWAGLGAAFGPATAVGALIRELVSADAAVRDHGLDALFSTIWHQGTVYDASPVAIPFLVAVATDADQDPDTRTSVCFLLACMANADSYVLKGTPTVMRLPRWRVPASEPAPARDLVEECRLGVAVHAERLVEALPAASPPVEAGLLAGLAAAAPAAPVLAEAAGGRFLDAADPRMAAAGELLMALARHDVSGDRLQELAGLDPTALDVLQQLAEWPVDVRAAQLVLELMTAVVGDHSPSNGR